MLRSKKEMSIHKFGKPLRSRVPKALTVLTVQWKPRMDVKYPPKKRTPATWEIYAQECLTILPHEAKRIFLSFGVMMSKGMVLTSLKQELKYMHLSTQNETLIESVDDIIVTIQNNSSSIAIINEGSPLCHVIYLV